jgi:acyl-CoA synthetase (AMP-forming)/AMP-acid ligase II
MSVPPQAVKQFLCEEAMCAAIYSRVVSGVPELFLPACRDQPTACKIPGFFQFLPELPQYSVGKVLRRELREQAGMSLLTVTNLFPGP